MFIQEPIPKARSLFRMVNSNFKNYSYGSYVRFFFFWKNWNFRKIRNFKKWVFLTRHLTIYVWWMIEALSEPWPGSNISNMSHIYESSSDFKCSTTTCHQVTFFPRPNRPHIVCLFPHLPSSRTFSNCSCVLDFLGYYEISNKAKQKKIFQKVKKKVFKLFKCSKKVAVKVHI